MFKLGPYEIAARTLFFIVGVVVLILVVGFTVRSCDKRHNQAAQARVEHAQSEAQSNSAADAIGTVAALAKLRGHPKTSPDPTSSKSGEPRAQTTR
jgi:ABC-type xylose transport system permease subunit